MLRAGMDRYFMSALEVYIHEILHCYSGKDEGEGGREEGRAGQKCPVHRIALEFMSCEVHVHSRVARLAKWDDIMHGLKGSHCILY